MAGNGVREPLKERRQPSAPRFLQPDFTFLWLHFRGWAFLRPGGLLRTLRSPCQRQGGRDHALDRGTIVGRFSFPDNREMSCELRSATVSDEPFLWEMLYLALFVPPGEPPPPRSVLRDPAIARYVEGWGMRSGDSGLIALVDGAPVGAAWLRCFAASDPSYGFVDEMTPELSVAVLPAHRDKGIGSRLIERLLRGVHATSLSCDPANPA
jgi:GNAT superfamily N-acetyltransferase